MPKKTKDERGKLTVNCPSEVLEKFERAADLAYFTTRSAWVLNVLNEEADRVIKERGTVRDAERFERK